MHDLCIVAAECRFCGELPTLVRVVEDGRFKHWRAVYANQPADGTAKHIWVIPNVHLRDWTALSQDALDEYVTIWEWIRHHFGDHNFNTLVRSGHPAYNGGDTEHLCVHMMAQDQGPTSTWGVSDFARGLFEECVHDDPAQLCDDLELLLALELRRARPVRTAIFGNIPLAQSPVPYGELWKYSRHEHPGSVHYIIQPVYGGTFDQNEMAVLQELLKKLIAERQIDSYTLLCRVDIDAMHFEMVISTGQPPDSSAYNSPAAGLLPRIYSATPESYMPELQGLERRAAFAHQVCRDLLEMLAARNHVPTETWFLLSGNERSASD